MKRIVIYIAVLALLTLAPVEGAELGKMRPVEVVLVYQQEGEAVIATDTEDVGRGADALSALENLKATTPGTIYLDTAEFLLIGEDGETVAEQLRPHLKKNVKVCRAEQSVKIEEIAAFLSAHDKLPRLKDWKMGDNLPRLQVVDRRFLLV